MDASGYILAYLPSGDTIFLAADHGTVVDASRGRRPRAIGACPRRSWLELCDQADELWWHPADRHLGAVRHIPRRLARPALDRLRRAHQHLAPPAAA
jgi:hypothetical protein